MAGVCSVEGCANPVRSRGLCNKHYVYAWRHDGRLSEERPTFCTVEGCGRKHRRHGLCEMHSKRQMYRRTHSPTTTRQRRPECLTEGCTAKAMATGYCEQCVPTPTRCDHDDCPNPHFALGLCEDHLQDLEDAPFYERPPHKVTVPPPMDWDDLVVLVRRKITWLNLGDALTQQEIFAARNLTMKLPPVRYIVVHRAPLSPLTRRLSWSPA